MSSSPIDLQGLLTDSAWREGLILCMNMSCWNNYATACFPSSAHCETPQWFLEIHTFFWFCISVIAVVNTGQWIQDIIKLNETYNQEQRTE